MMNPKFLIMKLNPFIKFSAILLLFIFQNISAQQNNVYDSQPKYPFLFKALIPIERNEPEWIHKMYSEKPNIFEIEKAYLTYYKSNDFVKTLHTQNYKHLMKLVHQNRWFDDNGFILINENQEMEQSFLRSNNTTQLANWTPIGPLETYENGGIVTGSHQVNVYTIAQSNSNPLVMLCGTETGAIFKSTDKGDNWFPLGNSFFNDGVSSVEIDPTNADIMFVGSSNRIYRSTDGGISWSQVLNVSSLHIYEFAINPLNNQIIFAAGNKGLYKSIDGGSSWSQVYTEVCWDIKFKSDDAQTIFLLKSNTSLKLTEFYKSIDGGATFTLKSNGWFVPTSTSSIGGARMGVTNADANRIYVAMLGNVDDYATDVNFIGVYRSDNAGESWTLPYDQNNDGIPNNNPGGLYSANHWCFSCFDINGGSYDQGFYNLAIDVSDTDPNKFLMGMLNLFKSENGGVTFNRWGGYACDSCTPYYRHPDHQDILVNGNDVFVATDGGIDLYDANLNIIRAINKGINGSDNWGFGQGWNEDVVTAGRYHNGNGVYHTNYGNGKFISLGGGESATGYVSLGNNFQVYHSDISAQKITSNLTTLNTSIPNFALFPNESYYTSNKSEIVYDPRYFNHMYMGSENKLWKSEDGGYSFNLIQAFGSSTDNIVTGIEVSRQNPNIIFVAQRDGSLAKLWRTQDGGISWTQITLPSTHVTMYLSLNESNTLFIGFGSGSNKVFKSNDLGNSWINLTTSTISSQGVTGVIVQMGTNDGVYITMSGNNQIYYRNATHSDWQLFNHGLPINKRFMGVLPFYKNGEIRVSGTRGFWRSPLFEISIPVAQPMVANKEVNCSRQLVQFDDYSVLNHTGASWQWSFPGATTVSSTTIRNPIVTYSNPGSYDVTLTVTDANGISSTKTIQNMIVVDPSFCLPKPMPEKSIYFNGVSNQYLTMSFDTPKTVSNFTLTAWIKPDGIQSDYSSIFYTNGMSLDFKNSRNELGTHCGGLWWYNSGLIVPKDKWSYVALIYTPTKVTIILNEQKYEINASFLPQDLTTLDFGIHNRRGDRQYKGYLEEVCLWDKALTIDEIRLNRHLTKIVNNDPNFFAYYQFNDVLTGKIYDVIGDNDLTVINGVSIMNSSCPIGPGISKKINIAQNNTIFDFDLSQVKITTQNLNFNGDVIVTKLNSFPFLRPNLGYDINSEHYIIENYGTNNDIGILESLQFSTVPNIGDLSNSQLKLYQRERNSDLQSDWIDKGSPSNRNGIAIDFSHINITTPVPFNNNSSNNILYQSSGQFYVTSLVPLSVSSNVETNSIIAFPNPIYQGGKLTFLGIDEDFKFILYDINGKIVLKRSVFNNNIIIDDVISKGIYFYKIETIKKIFNGKIIIE